MNFILAADRITKKQLLTHRTEEEYMSFYLGINPDTGIHVNPLRKDRRPSASFYRGKDGQLVFKDWATGERLNFVDVVMVKFTVGFDRALKMIGNDFGIISKPHYEKNVRAVKYEGGKIESGASSLIQGEVTPFKEVDVRWWKSFGISEKTLKFYDVHNINCIFLNGEAKFFSSKTQPIYGYYFGKEDGRELWKMYMPKRLSFRFLLNTNKLQGLKQLPKTGDVLVVTKSMKDVMVYYEMGIAAVATQGETVLLTEKQYAALSKRFTRIIFNFDYDPTGILGMANSRRRYPGIAVTFTDKIKFGKDISDCVKNIGFEKTARIVHYYMRGVMHGNFDYQLKKARNYTPNVTEKS